jgi:hypothetical protein
VKQRRVISKTRKTPIEKKFKQVETPVRIEQICLGGSVGRESDFSLSHLGVEESGSILADGH